MKKRFACAFPALLIGLAALLLWSGLTTGHVWGDDFSSYIMQARSLAEGKPSEFVAANRFIVEQSSAPIGPTAYPWGFPALLAPVYALFGLNLLALKSVGVVCYLLFLLLLWRGFRRYHAPFWQIALLGLFAMNPTMLKFMNNILSDVPFLLISTFSVLLIGRLVIDRRRLISPAWDQLLLGAAMAAAFLIRTHGILLLATLGITHGVALIRWARGRRAARDPGMADSERLRTMKYEAGRHLGLNILPYASFAFLILAWQAVLPAGGLYRVSSMRGISTALILDHLRYYLDLPAAFFAGAPTAYLLYGASLPLAIAGAMSRYRSDHPAIVYAALTGLLYVLWPEVQGLRFILPILPFYMSFVLSSLENYGNGMTEPGRSSRRAIGVLPVVLVLLCFGWQSVCDALGNLARHRASDSGPFVEPSLSFFSYIRDNAEAGSTVAFFKPRAMRMMTGRRSLMVSEVGRLSRGDYVCLCLRAEELPVQPSPDDVRALTEKGTIRETYRNRDFVVYRLTDPRPAGRAE